MLLTSRRPAYCSPAHSQPHLPAAPVDVCPMVTARLGPPPPRSPILGANALFSAPQSAPSHPRLEDNNLSRLGR
ncbi:hypothetical protein BDY21DRAFT_354392 [Lineolata rhizophorae]|uniref:Uncharacterized protein n=1 Tax=Lineolata rhizophorae TaxID=578093 RepID=A0A6A6NQA7_9PEZI|nr:hypothetical protein BDY21DRAFT_354392 [Lineolata rhizophorae]